MPTKTRLTLGISLAMLLVLGGCGPATPASTSNTTSASNTPSDGATSDSTSEPPAEQTDTDWGRIWDGVPDAFPIYPGAAPADDAATEVVSATFALEGTDARTVAGWMQTELERAQFATEALNGPLEDGSFVLDSTGASDCRIQVTIGPLGGLTSISVRYGAACPPP
jgi:hypothetical protein